MQQLFVFPDDTLDEAKELLGVLAKTNQFADIFGGEYQEVIATRFAS
jgi:hypothetical protein